MPLPGNVASPFTGATFALTQVAECRPGQQGPSQPQLTLLAKYVKQG